MRVSNADGVVIGRGCLGRPWLFKQLGEIFSGKEVSQFPTLGEVGDTMLAHAKAVVEWNDLKLHCERFENTHLGI